MIITSFKQNVDLYAMENNPFLFNIKPTLDHLTFLFIPKPASSAGSSIQPLSVLWYVAITLLLASCRRLIRSRDSRGAGVSALGIGIFLTYLVPPTLLFIKVHCRE